MANISVDGKPSPADVCVIELGGTIGTQLTIFFALLVEPVVSHVCVVFVVTSKNFLACRGH